VKISNQGSTINRALHFSSRHEIETRPDFDGSCLVTRQNYAGLIGDYALPQADRVQCQLQRKRDRCNQSHGIGWVARTKDGHEAYIGHDCADKYFGARSEFAQDRARAVRELEVDRLIARIVKVRADPKVPNRLFELWTELGRLYGITKGLIERLPPEVVRNIRAMAKLGRPEVTLEFMREERTDDPDKPRLIWEPISIGAVRGVAALDLENLRALANDVRATQKALAAPTISRDTQIRELRGLAKMLEAPPQIDTQTTAAAERWEMFYEAENIELCAFLTKEEGAQIQVFWTARGGSVSRAAAAKAWQSASRQISAQHDGRRFRIP
jgi:hypothetical protein